MSQLITRRATRQTSDRTAAQGTTRAACVSRGTALTLLAAWLPLPAAAHDAGYGALSGWNTDPWIWLPLVLAAVLYLRGGRRLPVSPAAATTTRWQARSLPEIAFWAALGALFAALIWPLDVLSDTSFAAHMSQHMLLIAVAAPLLVTSAPAARLVAGLPAPLRRLHRHSAPLHRLWRALLRPRAACVLHGLLIWLWHAPLLYDAALRHESLHLLEHVSFFGSALLFWDALQHSTRPQGRRLQGGVPESTGAGMAVLLILLTLMHTGLLGALLTFAPRPLYALGGGAAGLTSLEDQQLAGLIMWIPGALSYLLAGLAYAAACLRPRRVLQRE